MSNLRQFLGSLAGTVPYVARSAAYTVTPADAGMFIDMTSIWTLGLPAVATVPVGFTITVRNSGTGTTQQTIDPSGSELIDGRTTIRVYPGESFQIVNNGSAWRTFGRQFGLVHVSAAVTGNAALVAHEAAFSDSELTSIRIVMENVTGSLSAAPAFRIKKGATYLTSGYSYNSNTATSTASETAAGTATQVPLGPSGVSYASWAAVVEIASFANTGVAQVVTYAAHTSSSGTGCHGWADVGTAGAISGIQFNMGGTVTMSAGIIRVFGYRSPS